MKILGLINYDIPWQDTNKFISLRFDGNNYLEVYDLTDSNMTDAVKDYFVRMFTYYLLEEFKSFHIAENMDFKTYIVSLFNSARNKILQLNESLGISYLHPSYLKNIYIQNLEIDETSKNFKLVIEMVFRHSNELVQINNR